MVDHGSNAIKILRFVYKYGFVVLINFEDNYYDIYFLTVHIYIYIYLISFIFFMKRRNKAMFYLTMHSTHWVIMEFNVAAGIFHPFATIKQ